MKTPNPAAFKHLLSARYGYSTDDVPHRDLLGDTPHENGTLFPPQPHEQRMCEQTGPVTRGAGLSDRRDAERQC